MRRAGCILAILGASMCAASAGFFGSSVFHALAAHEAHVSPLAQGETFHGDTIRVDPAKFCQIAVRGLVRSQHAKRGSEDGDWDLQYAFPFRYTVTDSAGRVLARQERDFASDGGWHTVKNERASEGGGSARIEQGFEKFAVPPPGEIRVEATLGLDRDFGASVETPEIVIYDNVSKHARRVGAGIGLLVVGGVAAMAGFVLVIVAAARSGG